MHAEDTSSIEENIQESTEPQADREAEHDPGREIDLALHELDLSTPAGMETRQSQAQAPADKPPQISIPEAPDEQAPEHIADSTQQTELGDTLSEQETIELAATDNRPGTEKDEEQVSLTPDEGDWPEGTDISIGTTDSNETLLEEDEWPEEADTEISVSNEVGEESALTETVTLDEDESSDTHQAAEEESSIDDWLTIEETATEADALDESIAADESTAAETSTPDEEEWPEEAASEQAETEVSVSDTDEENTLAETITLDEGESGDSPLEEEEASVDDWLTIEETATEADTLDETVAADESTTAEPTVPREDEWTEEQVSEEAETEMSVSGEASEEDAPAGEITLDDEEESPADDWLTIEETATDTEATEEPGTTESDVHDEGEWTEGPSLEEAELPAQDTDEVPPAEEEPPEGDLFSLFEEETETSADETNEESAQAKADEKTETGPVHTETGADWDPFSEENIEAMLTPSEDGEETLDDADTERQRELGISPDELDLSADAAHPVRKRNEDDELLDQRLPEDDDYHELELDDLQLSTEGQRVSGNEAETDQVGALDEAIGSYSLPPQLSQGRSGGLVSGILWGTGILVLVAGLALQYIYYHRTALAENTTLRPLLSSLCDITDCRLPPRRALDKIELADHLMQFHPRYNDSLLITATLVNRADFIQPFPVVEVVMTDLQQKVIARRRFLPKQYLIGGGKGKTFTPNTEIPLMLEVVDPGENAVGFEFHFY